MPWARASCVVFVSSFKNVTTITIAIVPKRRSGLPGGGLRIHQVNVKTYLFVHTSACAESYVAIVC